MKKKLLFLLTAANCLLCMQCSQRPEEVIIRPQILAWDQTTLEIDTVFRTDTATILDIQGVPTYLIVNKQGTITDRSTGFPGIDIMKQKLEKALE